MSSVSVMAGEFLILNVKARDVLDIRSMSMFRYYLCTRRREQVRIDFYAGDKLLVSEKVRRLSRQYFHRLSSTVPEFQLEIGQGRLLVD
jgi:hypothetical protein